MQVRLNWPAYILALIPKEYTFWDKTVLLINISELVPFKEIFNKYTCFNLIVFYS